MAELRDTKMGGQGVKLLSSTSPRPVSIPIGKFLTGCLFGY
jgi:hypothetical protein